MEFTRNGGDLAGKCCGSTCNHVAIKKAKKTKKKPSTEMDLCISSSLGGISLHVTAWDVSTGVVHRVYSCETSFPDDNKSEGRSCLCVLGHSHILCSSTSLPLIYVWNSGKEQAQMKIACPGIVLALACSPDGTHCAAAIDEKIYIWEVCSGHLLAVASLHYGPVKVLRFTDDGAHLLSGSDDCRVVVWRMARVLSDAFDSSGYSLPFTHHTPTRLTTDTPLTRHVWSHHSQPVTSIHCGSGGLTCRVATASLDQTCKLYELSSGSLLCSILFDFGLTSVTLDLDEHFLFVGGSTGQISQVNLFTQTSSKGLGLSDGEESIRQSHFIGHSQPVTGLVVTSWAQQLVSTSEEDSARVWDINSHQTLREVKLKGPVSALVKPGMDFSISKPAEVGPGWLHSPPLHIQPFKKQLHFKSLSSMNGTDRGGITSVAAQIHRRVDPLCDLASLNELETCYSFPPLSNESVESLAEHGVKQELSEVKEVNKKLYKFMMDQLFEPSTNTSSPQ